MESRVSSRLSPKRYETNLNEIYEEDVGYKTEVYKVDIFGHNLHISPGKVIYDTEIPNLIYSYIYVVQGDKATMKLGVYEQYEESPDIEVFDLEKIKKNGILLFEYYETNSTKIAELEVQETTSETNPFDLIVENLFTPASEMYKSYETKEGSKLTTQIYNHLHKQYKELEPKMPKELYKIFKYALGEVRKTFTDKKFNTQTIEFMKTYCGNKYDDKFTICLAILGSFLRTKFILVNSAGNVSNELHANFLVPFEEPTHYAILRNFEVTGDNLFGEKTVEITEGQTMEVYTELPIEYKLINQNVSVENATLAAEAEEEEVVAPNLPLDTVSEEQKPSINLNASQTPSETKPEETKPTKLKLKTSIRMKGTKNEGI